MRRQPLGEVADDGFGSEIGGNLGQQDIGVHRADVQDAAALALHHILGETLGGQQGGVFPF